MPLNRLLAALALALFAALATAAGAAGSMGATRKATPSAKRLRAARPNHWRHKGTRHLPQHHRTAHHAPPPDGAVRYRRACAGAGLRPTRQDLARVRAATLCLVNRQRVIRGERPLSLNGQLERTAQGHSEDMAFHDYFEHSGARGDTLLSRMRAAGYLFSARIGYEIGENIGWGTLWLATPRAMVAAWMASPGHRANILDPRFRDTAIGISPRPPSSLARGQAGAIYTQDFGGLLLAGSPGAGRGSPGHAHCATYGQCVRPRPRVWRGCPHRWAGSRGVRPGSRRRPEGEKAAARRSHRSSCARCRGCRRPRRAAR